VATQTKTYKDNSSSRFNNSQHCSNYFTSHCTSTSSVASPSPTTRR